MVTLRKLESLVSVLLHIVRNITLIRGSTYADSFLFCGFSM